MTSASRKVSSEAERRAITEAAVRLLEGRPERSGGELTKSELAREAGLKRHHVANKHIDLADQFMRQVADMNGEPVQVAVLKDDLSTLKARHHAQGVELREARALVDRYADHLATAVLRIQQLERELERRSPSGGSGNVSTMPSRRGSA